MFLAGDVGATKTLLGLYERDPRRPRPLAVAEFPTLRYDSLAAIIDEFLSSEPGHGRELEAAVIGAAGPVRDGEVVLTNVPWRISASDLAARTGATKVALLNDVEAMAYCVEALAPDEQVVLQAGNADRVGNAALVSIGTGVGMAILHRVGTRFVPLSSEGGHADFAARTEREIALVRALRPRHNRVEIERVVWGPGLAQIARFTHGGTCPRCPPDLSPADEPAQIARQALEGICLSCREALDMFVEAMGAVAGNLGVTAKATGGVFVGGGIPRKILPALESGRFMAAFVAKAPVEGLVQSMPVTIITLTGAGLLGAAVYANGL